MYSAIDTDLAGSSVVGGAANATVRLAFGLRATLALGLAPPVELPVQAETVAMTTATAETWTRYLALSRRDLGIF
jgi:hypothetical protein